MIPLIGVAAFILDGIFVGITNTKGLLLSSIVASLGFFVVYCTFRDSMCNHALWMAFVVFLGLRGVVEGILYYKLEYKTAH